MQRILVTVSRPETLADLVRHADRLCFNTDGICSVHQVGWPRGPVAQAADLVGHISPMASAA